MPGLNLYYAYAAMPHREVFDDVFAHSGLSANFQVENIYHEGRTDITLCQYPGYHFRKLENSDYLTFFEGMIFESTESAGKKIDRLVAAIHSGDNEREHLAALLMDMPGDFIIITCDKKNAQWAFINDPLGRLPAYFYKDRQRLVITRHLAFMRGVLEGHRYDVRAIAQILLLGYALDTRTMVEKVWRIPPATLIRWNKKDASEIINLHRFDFDRLDDAVSGETAAAELEELFVTSCEKASALAENRVVSLSGGLDSRAVAAGLVKAGAFPEAMTYISRSHGPESDGPLARQIAGKLGIPWGQVRTSPVAGRAIRHQLEIKGGANTVGMAFYLAFLKAVSDRYSSQALFFTGDGGDKALPDLSPPKQQPDLNELTKFVIARNNLMPLDRVCELTGLKTETITDSVKELLMAYPEVSTDGKYRHFVIHERGINWLFEGEDRNRCYFRCVTPFYYLPFFARAMQVPPSLKKKNRLYESFLKRLNPKIAAIPDSNFGAPIGSLKYRVQKEVLGLLARNPGWARTMKSKLLGSKGPNEEAPIVRCLQMQFASCNDLQVYLDYAKIKQLLAAPGGIGAAALYNLFTLTSTICKSYCGEDFLNDFLESRF